MSGSIPLEEVAQADQSRQCHPHSFGLVNSLEEENVRNGDQHAKGTSHLVDRDRYGDSHEEEGYVPGQRSSEAQTLLEHRSTASQHLRASKDDRVKVLGVSLPRNLLYLLAIPPLLVILWLIGRIFHLNPGFSPGLPLFYNGTHSFHPTTILVSLDGFRPAYFDSHPHLVPNLLKLANSTHGLRAESMQPRFPTLTFPNHWSLMTGLYPESHGIVANDFFDPEHGRHFVYTKHEQSWDPDWWWGEPMWSVAERGGRKAANIMWPGPPVTSAGYAPSYFVPFKKMSPADKLTQVLNWLDQDLSDRPHLITTYIPNVDQQGHQGGPESVEVEEALVLVDAFVGDLVSELQDRNLTDIVNVVIVSDHGMTSTANERLIWLDDILGEEGYANIEHRDGWPSVGLRFKKGSPVDVYLDRLLVAAGQSGGTFAVYTHETMPERWHFNSTERIAPIYVVPHLGWALTDHHEFDTIHKGEYSPKGNHGYDNVHPDMQAIFLAHGPFARQLKLVARKQEVKRETKRGWISLDPPVMESFANLEVFSLVMRLMGLEDIEPAHNGTKGFWDRYLGLTSDEQRLKSELAQ